MLHDSKVTTIERFIFDQEHRYPEATGEFSNLLYDIALAAKIIAANIRRAGLVNILGSAGTGNVQGEEQQKLDVFANETIKNCLNHTGRVCVMGSEEEEDIIPVPEGVPPGKYTVLFDPLDGSSNIDVNGPVGTIFSIYRRVTKAGQGELADVLQPGVMQVGAGYVLYGSSVMLVYTTGQGVHGFTLDPTIGEFLLCAPEIKTPRVGKYYSVNESNFARWDKGTQRVVRGFHGDMPEIIKGKNSRYIGSLVADFHRNLIAGGIFMYPADTKNPNGKLRLLYEAAPMAFIAEQAGGSATNGYDRILDIQPTGLHQRTPLVIGSREDVGWATDTLRAWRDGYGIPGEPATPSRPSAPTPAPVG
ncbi:MAG TPA: class 1 fructose-bisphosphatase [Gemmatimonadales bacterium]|nr:class 1 fructose-bisphosphatase [Gemmatimonadales bacterium]